MDRNQKDTTRNSPKRKHQNTCSAWKISNSKAFTITLKQKTITALCDRHEFDIIHFLTECEGTRNLEMMLFREDTDEIGKIEDSLHPQTQTSQHTLGLSIGAFGS